MVDKGWWGTMWGTRCAVLRGRGEGVCHRLVGYRVVHPVSSAVGGGGGFMKAAGVPCSTPGAILPNLLAAVDPDHLWGGNPTVLGANGMLSLRMTTACFQVQPGQGEG